MKLSTPSPLQEVLNQNLLINVPVDCAAKSTRSRGTTLILGSLYSLLVQYVGSTNQDPGFFVKLYDTLLLALQ